MECLKISGQSSAIAIAGAIASEIRKSGVVELQSIGAAAINQAIKGVAIARGFVAPHGFDLVCVPAFIEILIDDEKRTAIKLIIRSR